VIASTLLFFFFVFHLVCMDTISWGYCAKRQPNVIIFICQCDKTRKEENLKVNHHR